MLLIGDIRRALGEERDRLFTAHVTQLWVFGSVALGQARHDSDIDVLVQLDDSPVGLLALVRLQALLEETLSREIDLIERDALYDDWAERILGEAVLVFDGG